jgi:hypothetical protein
MPLLVALAAACYDPVHADDVASLGPEAPGVPEGPTHRPGQHCTTCHGGDGPGDPQWSVAGTIFAVRGQPAPEVNAVVTVTDARGKVVKLTTNSVGNFYVSKDNFDPVYPLKVQVDGEGITSTMTTNIGRDGGCGACHRGPGNSQYTPAVYLRAMAVGQ